jgi:hypothetical protein
MIFGGTPLRPNTTRTQSEQTIHHEQTNIKQTLVALFDFISLALRVVIKIDVQMKAGPTTTGEDRG